MTNRTNKEILLEFYRLFYNEKHFSEGSQLLADDFINHHPGARGSGRQGMIEDFGRLARDALREFHIEPRRMAAEADLVWTHSLITGLPDGLMAVSVDIWRFEGGQIAEHWDVAQRLKQEDDPARML